MGILESFGMAVAELITLAKYIVFFPITILNSFFGFNL